MIDRKLEEIKSHMHFYRDAYRRGIKQLIFLLMLIVLLIAVIFYNVLYQALPLFYASTTAGEIVKLTSLNSPNKTSVSLIK
ncbi:MAG: hypothetical protein ACD_44C00373G0002 [uncultured bacterium]|nr:MAG: hypothetical protein ACD_44C00373G0002 [uncultured bacterium]OGT16082.1 MAG: hypothetical protein A3B69_00615 [Gammaproteobacteria bacterium RIFCSPHIGHO2_02_FULL_38_33]OGT24647.1 MAG: hypothetical protein A2W47_06185 [Gammaproteobacteria bacterium RIFCSPHIGHO2_12_38_15]OGT67956.1 MAG: hypothetical protein A3I12_00510 [Gammaproteobacteria bacterium RIFCSPLOWO2_02_FULL_38_11]OGT77789.1 MAG: hypothetical protein A3G71_06090 [Gammaproteobacteria bacterium RIFCSPLOWO2_12_FULL_38_14]